MLREKTTMILFSRPTALDEQLLAASEVVPAGQCFLAPCEPAYLDLFSLCSVHHRPLMQGKSQQMLSAV